MQYEQSLGRKEGSADDSFARARRRVYWLLGVWGLLAAALSASNIALRMPRPLIPALIWLPTLAVVVAFARSERVRAVLRSIPLRVLVLYHVVRIVFGVGVVVLYAQGRLVARFALTAGPGDIVAGVLGIAVALWALPAISAARRRVVLAWNVLALADIMLVFFTAQSILFSPDPSRLDRLRMFPWSMVAFGVVALILITHFLVFDRVRLLGRGGVPSRS